MKATLDGSDKDSLEEGQNLSATSRRKGNRRMSDFAKPTFYIGQEEGEIGLNEHSYRHLVPLDESEETNEEEGPLSRKGSRKWRRKSLDFIMRAFSSGRKDSDENVGNTMLRPDESTKSHGEESKLNESSHHSENLDEKEGNNEEEKLRSRRRPKIRRRFSFAFITRTFSFRRKESGETSASVGDMHRASLPQRGGKLRSFRHAIRRRSTA